MIEIAASINSSYRFVKYFYCQRRMATCEFHSLNCVSMPIYLQTHAIVGQRGWEQASEATMAPSTIIDSIYVGTSSFLSLALKESSLMIAPSQSNRTQLLMLKSSTM